jgi:tetratricopeptide (TPR) repeat protein
VTLSRASLAVIATLAAVAAARAQDPSAAPSPSARLDASDLDRAPLPPERRAAIERALDAQAYDRAQTLLLEEVERQPRSPEILRVTGGVLFLTGRYLDAAIALKKAEALAPLDLKSRFTLAMSYVVLGRRDWARPELESLARADARNPLYPYWLARLDYDREHYAEAVDGFRRALALDPTYLKALDNLGLALEALGREDEAIASYRDALRIERERKTPEDGRSAGSPWPAMNLGILLTRMDRLDEAEPLLRESVATDPSFAPAHYQLGLLLEKTGRAADAIAELERAASLDPRFAEPHYALARVFRRAGQTEKADRALERFRALKDEKGQAGMAPR